MNDHDSRRMRQLLARQSFALVERPEDADILLLNTCSVREKAENKALSLLGRFLELKKADPGRIVGLLGCLAAHRAEELLRRYPGLDLLLGPSAEGEIVDHLNRAMAGERVWAGGEGLARRAIFDAQSLPDEEEVSASITVMRGCDNYCSYCVVPYARGPQVSRPAAEIADEARRLIERGARELLLLGQNVNSYGQDLPGSGDFAALLERLGQLPGLLRLRFTTSHPKDLSQRLIDCFAALPALCPQLHLPLQSGSDRILARMNRGYTCAEYLEKVERLRRVRPGLAISSDLIVGFPGESEADFEATLAAMRAVRFSQVFSFPFSPRLGTASYALKDEPPARAEALARLALLQRQQEEVVLEDHRSFVGKFLPVLVEEVQAGPQLFVASGRCPYNRLVHFQTQSAAVGRLAEVKVTEPLAHCLRGREGGKC